MHGEFKEFLQRIKNNNSIDLVTKNNLINYVSTCLFSNVRVFNQEEYLILYSILEDLKYDVAAFKKLLETTYKIRNVISAKKENNKTVPKVDYLLAIHRIFKELDMDIETYDNNYNIANTALARSAYKIIFGNELINNEISFIELTKNIYRKYKYNNNINKTVCTILKILHKIDKGFSELDNVYEKAVTSEEFYSMFESYENIEELYFSDIIKEYYPFFGNELFLLIKNAVNNVSYGRDNTDYVFKFLNNVKERREKFDRQKKRIIKNITKIDIDTGKNIEKVFLDLIESIKANKNINDNVSQNIIANIKNVFDEYQKKQTSFVENSLDNFFANCCYYLNNMIISASTNIEIGIEDLIGTLASECKDFFLEYDARKFKEIINYVIENTDLEIEDLKEVAKKCSNFFKDADINKLKSINSSLNEFKNYINKYFKDNTLIADNAFEKIIINNPEFLLKNNKIDEVIGFLKGEISLADVGYQYSNFSLKKDFLSYNFYEKLKKDNYRILFEANLGKLVNNLNYLDEKCDICEIDFKEFNFNEEMIYTVLNNDLYIDGTNVLIDIWDIFKGKDLKKLMENNPDLLMMSSDDLEIIIKRCILNENSDYGFYDLLASELYFYKVDEFKNKKEEELMNKSFKYIDLDIENFKDFDIEEILTSNYIKRKDLDTILNRYEERKQDEKKLDLILSKIEEEEPIDVFELNKYAETLIKTYNRLYGRVANLSFKNKAIDVISRKKDKLEYEISDDLDELEARKKQVSNCKTKKSDDDLVIARLNDLINSIKSEDTRDDVSKFLTKFKEQHRSETEQSKALESIKILELKLQMLDREVEYLDYLLSIFNVKSSDVDVKYRNKKSFTINNLVFERKETDRNSKNKIEDLLNGKNLIIFDNSVNLEDIPNDKNFIEKIYKFLGETEFSIQSQNFMEINSLNKNFVEKLADHRSGIWSRRESRTPVRVYFIPIYTKHFTSYYVINVNYKDHAHLDGGCTNDAVYKRRMEEAKNLEKKLNEMDYDELLEFITESKRAYDEKMKPIVTKMESSEKKRKGKK